MVTVESKTNVQFADMIESERFNDNQQQHHCERTPLLGRRPMRKGDGINFYFLILGALLFGGTTIGVYLIYVQSTVGSRTYEFE